MGNSGSSSGNAMMPGAAVLDIATDDAVSSKTPPIDADLERALQAMGVDSSGMEPAETRRCWSLVSHHDFWRKHHAQHPLKKRVKTWMFVHGKFRDSAASLLQAADSLKASVLQGTNRQGWRAASGDVEASFKTFVKKIGQHSDFEDTQLFRFFREHVPEVQDDIRDLEADHSEKQLEEGVFSSLRAFNEEAVKRKPGGSSDASPSTRPMEQLAQNVVDSVRAYVTSLEAHLQKEERALVSRWLNLTPDLYSTYRGYLIGKYKIAY